MSLTQPPGVLDFSVMEQLSARERDAFIHVAVGLANADVAETIIKGHTSFTLASRPESCLQQVPLRL